jgi:hypothetical protein
MGEERWPKIAWNYAHRSTGRRVRRQGDARRRILRPAHASILIRKEKKNMKFNKQFNERVAFILHKLKECSSK